MICSNDPLYAPLHQRYVRSSYATHRGDVVYAHKTRRGTNRSFIVPRLQGNGKISNHLGNLVFRTRQVAMVTFSDRKRGVESITTPNLTEYYTAELTSSTAYYAFVLKTRLPKSRRFLHPVRYAAGESQKPEMCYSTGGYRYGFNGKENDDEVYGEGNSLDFGARVYDSRLGRWLSLDPLQVKYPSLSAYNFAGNTPIQAVDPDGKLILFVNGYQGAKDFVYDVITTVGIPAALIRAFCSDDQICPEEISHFDKGNYWDKIDDKFKERIGDQNAVYADGSSHMFSSADRRLNAGKEAGLNMLKKIESGDIKLIPGETIKIVAHSQGCAYAAGMAEVLMTNKNIKI
jgi:RHS repeat-associated protein